jgi:hypothetical protein
MRNERRLSRRGFLAASAAGAGMITFDQPSELARVEVADDTVKGQKAALTVKVNGKFFCAYNYSPTLAAIYHPYFHPVMGPNDKPITQMGEFPGSVLGHVHHRALFIGHQKVNNVSFWEESATCGRIIHLGFDHIPSGDEGMIVERLAWRNAAGNDVLNETRIVRIPAAPIERRMLDIAVKLQAVRGEVVLGATPYNLLACKALNAMCPLKVKREYAPPFGSLGNFEPMDEGGQITNSEGQVNEACAGARAKWCDFSGPLGDGTWGGVAILDHPSNPRHPTPWHNWNNMTIMASFTYHEPFTLKEQQELRLQYRILVHSGDAKKADIAGEWKNYSETALLQA